MFTPPFYTGGPVAAFGGAPTSLTGTYISTAESASNLSTYTFSAQDLGSGGATAPVLVGLVCVGGGGAGLGTMTVDGVIADPLFVFGEGTGVVEFFLARGVSNSSGDIVFVAGASHTSCAIAVWRLSGDPLLIDADPGLLDTTNIQLDTQVGGFVAAIGIGASKGSGTLDFSNLTSRVPENNIEGTDFYIAGDLIPDGTTETCDMSGTASVGGNSPQGGVSFGATIDTAVYPLEATNALVAASFSRPLVRSGNISGLYTDSGGAITQWTNQVVGRPSLTDGSSAARRPALTTAGPNSRSCADFDGSSNWLSASSAFVAVGTKYVIVSVIPDTIGATQGAIVGNAASTWNIAQQDSSGDKLFVGNFDGTSDSPTGQAATEGTAYVVALRHAGGTLAISVNGAAEVTVASGNSTSVGNLTVGAQGSGAQFADCKIFELGVWQAQPASFATIISNMMAWVGAV